VSFNSKITPWRERSVEVDQHNIQSAFDWINSLTAEGTTNTLAAIKFALNDAKNEAVYLLTDGRPDQVSSVKDDKIYFGMSKNCVVFIGTSPYFISGALADKNSHSCHKL
jgi:hypothetical protein